MYDNLLNPLHIFLCYRASAAGETTSFGENGHQRTGIWYKCGKKQILLSQLECRSLTQRDACLLSEGSDGMYLPSCIILDLN